MGRNTAVMMVFTVVALAVTVDVAWCWGEETNEESIRNSANEAAGHWRERANQIHQGAKVSLEDAKESVDSWADWAMGKVSGGIGLDQDGAKETAAHVVGKVEEAASKSTETVKTAVSGTSKFVSLKASDAANMASEKLGQAKDVASEKAIHTINKGSDLAGDAKETVSESMNNGKARDAYDTTADKGDQDREAIGHHGKDKANDAYNYASRKMSEAGRVVSNLGSNGGEKMNEAYGNMKESVGDKYKSAKEKMGEQAREKYEAAKEKTSDLAGNVGAKMRNNVAEL